MNLAQIDSQIAKWKELRSNLAGKLVELDGMPTYLAVCRGLYQGTTAAAIGELGNAINLMWTLSDLWEAAFAQLNAARAHSPLPWEREKWLNELQSKILDPVITFPAGHDVSQKPSLTLTQALREEVNQYERITDLIRRIVEQTALAQTKVRELSFLAESVGASKLKTQITDIADQVQSDPLGVSLDSFAAIEAQLNRLNAEITDRQAVIEAIEQGNMSLAQIEKLSIEAHHRLAECHRTLGSSSPVPSIDLSDLRAWGQTLRSRQNDLELGSVKVGLAKWSKAVGHVLQQLQHADQANQDSLNRYREVIGRFSAAKARAVTTRRNDPQADRIAQQIEADLAKTPKDLAALETTLATYENLVRG
jgi:hypothetical protein